MYPLLFLSAAVLCIGHCRGQCVVQNHGVNATSQKTIVRKHNELRAMVANGNQKGLPQAANMHEMVYDDALARKAQDWANKCRFEHDQQPDRDTGRGFTGQNIAFSTSQDPEPDWDTILQLLYDEITQFDPSTIDSFTLNEQTGHFTQIIWANSSRVGCGYVSFMEGGSNVHLYGCDYLPGGNIQGQPIYLRGPPCSKCGGCGSIEGLCQNKTVGNININLST